MNIGIDISQMAYKGTGVGSYVAGLTRALLTHGQTHNYVLVAGALQNHTFFRALQHEAPYTRARFVTLPIPPRLAPTLAATNVPLDLVLPKLDIFHTSDWAEYTTKTPRVTTVHDLVFRKFPETVASEIRAAQGSRLSRLAHNDTHIIVDSESTKIDLIEYYQIASNRIDVVYPGIDQIYKPATSKEIEQVKAKFNLRARYVLSVGTQEPRKNLERTVEAVRHIRQDPANQDLVLVLTGKYGWGEKLKLADWVVATGYVSEKDLVALYSGATTFVYPSLYEGFGFPILEAMACGAPVVTSNTSSLPELAGDRAVLVDPTDVRAIAAGISQTIQNPQVYRAAGYAQAAKFSWQRCAEQIICIYEKVANHAHRD